MGKKGILSRLTSLIVLLLIIGVVLFSGFIEDDEFFENDKLEFEYPADWTPVNFTAKNTSYSIQLYGNDTDIIFPVTIKTEYAKNDMYTSNDDEIILRKLVGEKYPEIAKNCVKEDLEGTGIDTFPELKYKAQVNGKTEIRIFFIDGLHFCMIEGKPLEDDYYLEEELEDIAESLDVKAL